jgi:hypothetical protein
MQPNDTPTTPEALQRIYGRFEITLYPMSDTIWGASFRNDDKYGPRFHATGNTAGEAAESVSRKAHDHAAKQGWTA